MSNSFTSTPTLVDPGRLTAGQTIRTTEIARLADLQNHIFAIGGTHNVISQTYDDDVFIQDSTTFVTMCQWAVPLLSKQHTTLVVNISGFCPTAANGTARLTLKMEDDTKYFSGNISITDESRYSAGFNQGTVTITGTHAGDVAFLSLEIKAPAGQEVVLTGVQAHWQALTSPLSTGTLQIDTRPYIPQGQNRQGADLPLSSRFGVETINNIETLRSRGRVLFNWSGVSGASSSSAITVAGAPPRAIGVGDLPSFYSIASLSSGTVENNLRVYAYVFVMGLVEGDSFDFMVMGNILAITQSEWSVFELDLMQDEHELSDQFGLSMYRVGPDERNANISGVASPTYPPSTSAHVAALTIIGV